jgi:DNA (cytosine-5)-methyltransferase 1
VTHIDLFSGIGGFALACKWNGIKTVQFVEIDQRCREFLSKTWPGVPIHDDIKTFHRGVADTGRKQHSKHPSEQEGRCEISGLITGNEQHEMGGRGSNDKTDRPVFILTGGVPCQPASRAGKQRGCEDDRWLWQETIRVLAEVRPTWALFENPPGIGDVGLAGILSEVEACGYEVRVVGVPACAVGSPQIRMRYWIVAHRNEQGHEEREMQQEISGEAGYGNKGENAWMDDEVCLADAEINGIGAGLCHNGSEEKRGYFASDSHWESYTWLPCADGKVRRSPDDSIRMAHGLPVELLEELGTEGRQTPEECEPHRSILGALGNSIIPQVAARIIEAIIDAEGQEGDEK